MNIVLQRGAIMSNRKTILYISMSLDGFIADQYHQVSWIEGEDKNHNGDYGYSEFIKTIDTVILGNRTYRQIITELSPNEWVYQDFTSYVFTNEKVKDTANIKFVRENIKTLIEKLKKQEGKDIWICGGSDIVNQCIKNNLIDEYRITIVPIILGKGLRLFNNDHSLIKLKWKAVKQENGLLECIYVKK